MKLQSGYPFSLIRYGLIHTYPKLEEDTQTDVVIVGGGISGALAAHHLVKAGVECVVVDGRTIGLGSTCASTSLIQYEIDVPLTTLAAMIGEKHAVAAYHDSSDAIFKLHDIAQSVGFQGFRFNKSLYYAAYRKDVNFLRKECLMRKQSGLKVEWMDDGALKAFLGFSAPGAILSDNGAYTDAYQLTHHLLQRAIRDGLRVFDRTYIDEVTFNDRSVLLTTAEKINIKAKKIVFATGYEVTEQITKKIVRLHSTYATISEHMPHRNPFEKKDVLLWNTANPYLYMRGTVDGRVIVGGRDEAFASAARRDKLIERKSRQLVKDYQQLFPDHPFNPEFSWTGTFGTTKDGLPFIGSFGKHRHRYFALGFGGNGITFSLIAAEIIRDQILGRKRHHADLYSFDRA